MPPSERRSEQRHHFLLHVLYFMFGFAIPPGKGTHKYIYIIYISIYHLVYTYV